MSFPPLNNPVDYDRYKAIYLQTLQQQINNNANNYNAVSLYQKTAQPPITPTDTRSIEDKFADEVGTQVRLRALIRQITDNDNTNDIMDDLIKDRQLLEFTLQNFPTIKEHFSKTSATGVNYPVFMAYIRMMRDERITKVKNMDIPFPNNPETDFGLFEPKPKVRPNYENTEDELYEPKMDKTHRDLLSKNILKTYRERQIAITKEENLTIFLTKNNAY